MSSVPWRKKYTVVVTTTNHDTRWGDAEVIEVDTYDEAAHAVVQLGECMQLGKCLQEPDRDERIARRLRGT